MKRKKTCLIVCLIMLATGVSAIANPAGFFPPVPGWQQEGEPELFSPDTLYEYINGAAEVFLNYDFVQLAMQTYRSPDGGEIVIEVYNQGSLANAFGMYAQEKTSAGEFLEIGAEGYYEEGVLNFYSGNYYVKMSGLDASEKAMKKIALAVFEAIAAGRETPPMLKVFPEKGLQPHSLRFVLRDFLGLHFLNNAYIGDYQQEGRNFQLFVIRARDEAGAGKMLNGLLQMAGLTEAPAGRTSTLQLRYIGNMHLQYRENYLWGMVYQEEINDYEAWLNELSRSLK